MRFLAFNTSPKHKLRFTKIQKQNPGMQTGHVILWKSFSQLLACMLGASFAGAAQTWRSESCVNSVKEQGSSVEGTVETSGGMKRQFQGSKVHDRSLPLAMPTQSELIAMYQSPRASCFKGLQSHRLAVGVEAANTRKKNVPTNHSKQRVRHQIGILAKWLMCPGLRASWALCLVTLLQLLYSPISQQNDWHQLLSPEGKMFNYIWKPCHAMATLRLKWVETMLSLC